MLGVGGLAVLSFVANGPQGLSPHGWVLFGEPVIGAPLYAHHGAGSLNTHRYDASWRLRLLDAIGRDITDSLQQARMDAPEGEGFWLGCCGDDPVPEYLLPQLAGSYFDRPQLTRVTNLPLYRRYNPPNAEGATAFKAAGKPVQAYADGSEMPTETGEEIFSNVTAVFERTMIFRSFDQNAPPQPALTYHLLGTNEQAFLQHRIAGGASSWSQVLPVSLDPEVLASSAAQPVPATTTLGADGTPTDTSALRTLDVAHGGCVLVVPDRADEVEARLAGGDMVDAEVRCLYFCSTAPPRKCLNDFEPLRSLSNNALLPTQTFRARVSAGFEQGLLSDNALMLPGAPALLAAAAAASPAMPQAEADLAAAAPPRAVAPLLAPPPAPAGPSFLLALGITTACAAAGAAAAWLALRGAARGGPPAGAAVGAPLSPRAQRRFKALGRDQKEEAAIKAGALETPSAHEALYAGPRSDDGALTGAPPPPPPPPSRAALGSAALAVVTVALGGAAALSGVGGAPGGRYFAGTVLAPLHPASHIFQRGFETNSKYEYSITLLRLPVADGEQTHEIYFDEGSRTAFTSIVTSSRLLQIPFAANGQIQDHVLEWTVGHPEHNAHPEDAGLHNVAHSYRHPGCVWISTETDDRIYLVDPSHGFRVLYDMHVPTALPAEADGTVHHVGGPHSVREAPDGSVWVALKGSNYDGPGFDDPAQAEYYKHMMEEHFLAEGEPVPDGWAVWHVDPEAYDARVAPGRGGTLYEALESPTMTAIDGVGNVWTTQDLSPTILHVDTRGVATQVALPSLDVGDGETWGFGAGNGPGIVTAPDGSVWLSNLGQNRPWLVRFLPGSTDPLIFKDLLPDGAASVPLHTIHMAFSASAGPERRANVMYVLTSSLLEPGGTEAVIVQEFDDEWAQPKPDGLVGHQEILLPASNSAAHRLTVAETLEPRSILVTGLLSNALYQIQGPSI